MPLYAFSSRYAQAKEAVKMSSVPPGDAVHKAEPEGLLDTDLLKPFLGETAGILRKGMESSGAQGRRVLLQQGYRRVRFLEADATVLLSALSLAGLAFCRAVG